LILADEPTGNLDSATGTEVIDLLMNYVKTHQATFVIVTHDVDLAQTCSERILHIQDGHLID
jgi:predicted ABC-type transport system involved in lysophospholipase L1 biosynthesis ATPase subunit